jgi:hypothetical protein
MAGCERLFEIAFHGPGQNDRNMREGVKIEPQNLRFLNNSG